MLLRSLILLLACMNLGVAAWWAVHREPQAVSLPVNEPGISTLSLLSEVDSSRLEAAAQSQAASNAPAITADAVCQSIGPFESAEALRSAMDSLLPKVERIQYPGASSNPSTP